MGCLGFYAQRLSSSRNRCIDSSYRNYFDALMERDLVTPKQMQCLYRTYEKWLRESIICSQENCTLETLKEVTIDCYCSLCKCINVCASVLGSGISGADKYVL